MNLALAGENPGNMHQVCVAIGFVNAAVFDPNVRHSAHAFRRGPLFDPRRPR